MNRRTLTLASLVTLLALAAVPFLSAEPHGKRGHGGRELGGLRFLGHARQELNLSDQQVAEVKAIFKSLHEQNATNREQLKGGMEEITATLLQDPSNVGAAQALIDKQAAAERAMKTNVLNATAKALNVLTAEQRTKLSAMISERKERVQQFRERRRD